MASDMEVAEATQRLIGAILVEVADRDDEDLFPLRLFFTEVAEAMKIKDFDPEEVDEWITAGEFRARCRLALVSLAQGEGPLEA